MDVVDGNCFGITNNNKQSGDDKDPLCNMSYTQPNFVAKIPTDRFASHYNMNHKQRGLAIIFNHEIFEYDKLQRRWGSKVDCDTLSKQLKALGFTVRTYQDLNFYELKEKVSKASEMDHTDYDCFFMAVLSHGEMGILYAKDYPYKPEILWSPFTAEKCPTLAGKPKLFFIQACQEDKLNSGISFTNRTETDSRPTQSYRIPTQADFLIAYSTIPGYLSWKYTTSGSWFIQALCEELEANAYRYDILTLLTFVNQKLVFDFESHIQEILNMHQPKEIPCITSLLTRLLHFPPPAGNTDII